MCVLGSGGEGEGEELGSLPYMGYQRYVRPQSMVFELFVSEKGVVLDHIGLK